ncbi:MAG: transcriptional repressor [Kosmotoga sp.]|nr:MAG: transcriptional repressor [Kosmotoga sp.]
MNSSNEEISNMLKKNGISLSLQKILIFDFLIKNQNHPIAIQIFNELADEIPTLSKTTVYNALSSFVNSGLIRKLIIDEKETRYEIAEILHGHFKCVECSEITNFDIDIDGSFEKELKDFEITSKEVILKGICPICLSKKGKK